MAPITIIPTPSMHALKSILEWGISHSVAFDVMHRRSRSGLFILAYHNIVPRGEAPRGELSLHLPQEEFAAQLEMLAQSHDIVSLEDALFGHGSSCSHRPRAVITFDDAYTGALSAGVEELEKRSIPATFFVPPGCIGGKSFWWDVFAHAQFRASAIGEWGGKDGLIRSHAEARGIKPQIMPDYAVSASEDQLCTAANSSCVSFGSHSWSHPNLTQLNIKELVDELILSQQWVRRHLPRVVSCISYPYGLVSPSVQIAAEGLNYKAGLCIGGNWVRQANTAKTQCEWEANQYLMPRINVPSGISRDGFRLRTAGMF